MSCVVALVENGVIWMGSDSVCCWDDDNVEINKDPKCFRMKTGGNEWLIGVVGVSRNKQIIHYEMELPQSKAPSDETLCGFIVKEFAPRLRKSLETHGLIKKKDNVDTTEMNLLVGLNGRLFKIDDRFHITEICENFTAIGAGVGEVRGIFYTTQKMKPRDRLLLALSVAEKYHAYVRAPFIIIKSKK